MQQLRLVFHKWIKQLPIVMFSEEMPEDVYKLLPGKGSITDQMFRDGYEGEPGEWVEQYGALINGCLIHLNNPWRNRRIVW